MRTACELPFLKSLVLAMANPFWMYVYILVQAVSDRLNTASTTLA